MKFALSFLCACAVSGAADARAQWWSSWYDPYWTTSWYAPAYTTSYYGYGAYYGGSMYGGSMYDGACCAGSYYGGSSYGGSCGTCAPCATGCAPCGLNCASYSNFGCNALCGLACSPCSACACSPCSCVGGNCSAAGCGTNCATDPNAVDSRGNLQPRPDQGYERPRDGSPTPNRTIPMDPRTYDEGPGDDAFRRRREGDSANPPMDPIDPTNRPPREELRRPETPVPQRRDDETGGPMVSRTYLTSTPARPLSLDDKITWRSTPERSRMKIRSKIATPVVARSTTDSNSGWAPVPGNRPERDSETKLVRR